jgi:putative tryptophan/tyrosine transport system substrate-binding protein
MLRSNLGATMRRREFITLLGGSMVAWPCAVRAQPIERVQRIGVLSALAADDPQGKAVIAAFMQGLQRLGWTDGRNLKTEFRWGAGNADDMRKFATELVSVAPDVLVATGGASVGPLLQATKMIPIVFANVPDPVGSGFVESLSRPGGNATGFVQFEYNLSAKWVELLKQIAPGVTNAAILWDPAIVAGIGQFAVIQAAAPSLGVDVRLINVRDAAEIERAVAAFAKLSNCGLVVTASGLSFVHRDLIVGLAAQYKLPTIYPQRVFVTGGGLISYGVDFIDQARRLAGYVDRILRGEKPADLPVQAPTKYELVINLKTAKAMGLTIPQAVLARADEVIE